MKVYILELNHPYESSDVYGVFSTPEKAMERAKKDSPNAEFVLANPPHEDFWKASYDHRDHDMWYIFTHEVDE